MSNPSNNSQMHNDIMAVGPYEITLVQLPYTPSNDENPRQPGEIVKETYCNTTLENRKLIDAKAKAVHMILNRIGESINIQDVKTKLFWEFGKFTSRDEESIESYYKRNKGEEIVKPTTPSSKSASEEDNDEEQA
ncbi:hypothetical protein Tco_0089673 [Tanacetum coccineum]